MHFVQRFKGLSQIIMSARRQLNKGIYSARKPDRHQLLTLQRDLSAFDLEEILMKEIYIFISVFGLFFWDMHAKVIGRNR